jgi:hypothetical protein
MRRSACITKRLAGFLAFRGRRRRNRSPKQGHRYPCQLANLLKTLQVSREGDDSTRCPLFFCLRACVDVLACGFVFFLQKKDFYL